MYSNVSAEIIYTFYTLFRHEFDYVKHVGLQIEISDKKLIQNHFFYFVYI